MEFRKVGLITCTALVLANMIGTGVFTSLGFQVAVLPSPFPVLMVWLLGGLVALCGALSYAELASALPSSGGEYYFLSRIYHPAIGFMAGFVSVTVGFAAPIALAAMAFGDYLAATFPGVHPGVASMVVVLLVALLHSLTVRASGNFQVVVTCLKVCLVVAFIVIGVWKETAHPVSFAPKPGDFALMVSTPFAISLMFVLYAYTGWNAAAYILSEVRRPEVTVPWALLIGTVIVTILYVSINAVFLAAAPLQDYVGKIEVGQIAAEHLLGDEGGRIMSGLISLGLISAISAMTWAGPRVTQAIGRDLASLKVLSATRSGGVPLPALGLQTLIVVILLLSATFEAVLVYAQFAILACSFLAVLGVIVLRWRQPGLPRPFRCWGYPVTPIVFLVLNLFAMAYSAHDKPAYALAGAATLLVGFLLYFPLRKRRLSA
ncbi:MAG: amino acid permease [Verrucomicrobia bacterium 61-8]|nr:amino acid permease [Verrucomicrobiota bacterium]OJV25736.1 MAG: amino acid permease [Verrucomicrobia bacterium 61-8]